MSNWHLCSSAIQIIMCASQGAHVLQNKAKGKLTKSRVGSLKRSTELINLSIALRKKKGGSTKIKPERGTYYCQFYRNKKNYERVLWIIVEQEIGLPSWNGTDNLPRLGHEEIEYLYRFYD